MTFISSISLVVGGSSSPTSCWCRFVERTREIASARAGATKRNIQLQFPDESIRCLLRGWSACSSDTDQQAIDAFSPLPTSSDDAGDQRCWWRRITGLLAGWSGTPRPGLPPMNR